MIRIHAVFIFIFVLKIYSVISFFINREKKKEDWAVLVAGSNSYLNYRHQANIAHAYQLLIQSGFDKNKIITMMYNDVVNHSNNPHKGQLFNKPNGADVYKGIHIDYQEEEVTAQNFLGILNGEEKKGKGLKVNQTERIFIFLSDHGSPGMFAFPDDILTADELVNAVKKLSKISKGVTIFVESCESGSLFMDHISQEDNKILAFSAANEEEPSYAFYWSDEMNAFLGDLFSVSWMETVEAVDCKKTSMLELYNKVKNLTHMSHVLNFGDPKMKNLSLKEVFGLISENNNKNLESLEFKILDRVPSHDAQIFTMLKLCQKNMNEDCFDNLEYLMQSKRKLDFIFKNLMIEMELFKSTTLENTYKSPYPDNVYTCYKNSVRFFSKTCINYKYVEKTFDYLGTFLQMCSNRMDEERIAYLIKANCEI